MKPILLVVTLALLLVVQQLPTYAQRTARAKKVPASTQVLNGQIAPPDLLGHPVSPCTCFIPCPEIDSLQATYTCVEKMPIPPGGSAKAYLDTLEKQIRIPIDQPDLGVIVIVYFVVTPTGQLTDFKIAKSLSPEYDAEAVRVIKAQPSWTPGYQNSCAVRVRIAAPVRFRIQ